MRVPLAGHARGEHDADKVHNPKQVHEDDHRMRMQQGKVQPRCSHRDAQHSVVSSAVVFCLATFPQMRRMNAA
jgi:hypothetical protein